MEAPPFTGEPRLKLEHISKTFGAFRALSDVSFDVRKGELHGLVGQNGSGKSTLAKVLTGYHAPDPGGVITVDGEAVKLPVKPADLKHHGVAVVHQSLGLLDDLTVIENLRLSRFQARRWSRRIDWRAEQAAVTGVLARLECEVDLKALVGSLPIETKATLAIARAIQSQQDGRGLIIFDESTRALNRDGLARFYRLVRGVLESGASVLLICHRLEEVLEHTDRITVLRDGRVAAAGLVTKDLTEADLTRTMLGYELTRHMSTRTQADRGHGGGTKVRIAALSGDLIAPFDLDIAPGEIVGITGLMGSGFSEIPYLLAGATPALSGTLQLADNRIDLTDRTLRARDFLDRGVALVPRDRDTQGLMMDQSIKVNITLPRVRAASHPLRIDTNWERQQVTAVIDQLGITPPEPDMLISALSGGNQQKVMLGKWLAGEPRLLLMHEPTQAVDVGARRDILNAIENTAANGCPVLIASSYADELAMICDRVIVFHYGEIVAELSGEMTEDEIIEATYRSRPC